MPARIPLRLVRWIRHPLSPRARHFDPVAGWPPVGKLDDRFTEDQSRYAAVYEWLQYAQYSPWALRQMPDDLLVYIAGHVHPPVRDLSGLTPQQANDAKTKDHKLLMNAERAAAELAMRRNRRVIITSSVLTMLATAAGIIVVALITL